MINMLYGSIRPAVPPPDSRRMFLYGGPCDGAEIEAVTPPPGYRDFAGVLVVWHEVRIAAMPFWQGDQFKAAVRLWHLTQRTRGE